MAFRSLAYAVALLLAVTWTCSAGVINNHGTRADEIEDPLEGKVIDHSNAQEILRNILNYLIRGDYKGLYEYLNNLPEITQVLNWLEENYHEIFIRICWLFNACGEYDLEIPIEVLQKIFQYIAREDWDGLAAYLKTIDNNGLLLEWIRHEFPQVWAQICHHFNSPKCPNSMNGWQRNLLRYRGRYSYRHSGH